MSRKTDLFLNNIRKDILHSLHPLQTFFIEINSTCNLNCKHCYIPKEYKQFVLDLEDICKSISLVKKEFGNSVGIAITGGEPLIHPNFKDISEYLFKNGFYWSLATNGLLLSKDIVRELIQSNCRAITVSLDGNQENHDNQRKQNGLFKKVLEKIDMLITKSFPNIYITATIHDGNVNSLEDMYRMISKYKEKVKWRINPLLYCKSVDENNLRITESTYSKICEFSKRVKKDLGISIIIGEKNPLSIKYGEYFYSEFDSCFAGISTFGILSNGDIANCMVCREKPLGNIKGVSSLKEVWDNQDLNKKALCEKHFISKDLK